MSARPNEGALVVVGPFTVVGPLQDDGTAGRLTFAVEGVRRYGEHNGELIPYVDFREHGDGFVSARRTR